MDRAEQTALDFTASALTLLIGHSKRTLVELDKLDARFGDAGRDAREEGRRAAAADLEIYENALLLK